MILNIDEYINSPIPIKRELTKYYSSDDRLIIFDIGACECEDSIRYANLFPNSAIFAFEPLPDNVKKIKKNIARHNKTNITLIEKALSDSIGQVEFFVSSGQPRDTKNSDWDYGNKSSSLLKPDKVHRVHDWLEFDKTIIVETDTIKHFCKENDINEINFVHLDVQGAELLVLNGAEEFIQKIGIIWMEVESLPFYKDQPLKKNVELFMKKNGFLKVKDTVNTISGDQLYIRKILLRGKNNLVKYYLKIITKSI